LAQNLLVWLPFGIVSFLWLSLFIFFLKYKKLPIHFIKWAILGILILDLGKWISQNIILYQNLKNHPLGKYLLKTAYFKDQLIFSAQPYLITFIAVFILILLFWIIYKIKAGRILDKGELFLLALSFLSIGWPNLIIALSLTLIILFFQIIGKLFLRIGTRTAISFANILATLLTLAWFLIISFYPNFLSPLQSWFYQLS
jgi:hypothetical protein